MHRIIAVIAFAATLTAALTSCSNEKELPAAPSTPTTSRAPASSAATTSTPTAEPIDSSSTGGARSSNRAHEDLQAAVASYSDAFLTGDPQTYALLTERCRDRVTAEQFQLILDQAKILYGSPLTIKTFNAETAGNLARVTYTYELAALNQTSEPWAKEDGDWKQDDCP